MRDTILMVVPFLAAGINIPYFPRVLNVTSFIFCMAVGVAGIALYAVGY